MWLSCGVLLETSMTGGQLEIFQTNETTGQNLNGDVKGNRIHLDSNFSNQIDSIVT